MFNISKDDRNEDILSGVFMVTVAGMGCIINIFVITLIIKNPLFHNAFGYISFSHVVADTAILFTNAFWAGPATLFMFDDSITDTFVGARIGQLMNFFWFEAFYCHLQIAVNRLLAVAKPFAYNKLFVGRNLVIFIASTWILSLFHAVQYSWYDCSMWFSAEAASWTYRNTRCTYIATQYISFIFGVGMSLLIVATNTLTLFYLQKEIRAIRKSSKSDSQQQMAYMKTNISFYIQGCIIAFIMILTLFLSRSLTEAASSKLQYVIFSTLIWDLAQSSSGQHCSSHIQQAIALCLFTIVAKHYTSFADSWLLKYLRDTEIEPI